jgi:hypothetical protein
MVRILKNLGLFFLIIAFYSCKENKTPQIPINEFFKTPEKAFFKMSPDGKYISYLKKHNKKQNIFIKSLQDGKEITATSFSDFSVRNDYMWTYDNQILFGQDRDHDINQMSVLDITTLQTKPILTLPPAPAKVKVNIMNRNKFTPDVITISEI